MVCYISSDVYMKELSFMICPDSIGLARFLFGCSGIPSPCSRLLQASSRSRETAGRYENVMPTTRGFRLCLLLLHVLTMSSTGNPQGPSYGSGTRPGDEGRGGRRCPFLEDCTLVQFVSYIYTTTSLCQEHQQWIRTGFFFSLYFFVFSLFFFFKRTVRMRKRKLFSQNVPLKHGHTASGSTQML